MLVYCQERKANKQFDNNIKSERWSVLEDNSLIAAVTLEQEELLKTVEELPSEEETDLSAMTDEASPVVPLSQDQELRELAKPSI